MPRVIIVAAFLALSVGVVLADSIEFIGYDRPGPDAWAFQYRYVRTGTLNVGADWRLYNPFGTVNATGGPTYWDDGTIDVDSVVWGYVGGDDPQSGAYQTFDVTIVLENGSLDQVPYEIDTDGDGVIDESGWTTSVTPEPGTLGLLAIGIGGLAAYRRRRKD